MPKQIILSDELVSVLKSVDHRFSDILINSHENKEKVVDNSYIDFSKEEGYVTYLPASREKSHGKEMLEQDKWLKGRQSISIGKWVRAILQFKEIEYKEFELEEFVNQYKYQQFDFNFVLVKGQDIVKWYKEKNYDNQYGSSGSSLFNSCMRAVSSEYFKIYRDNENVSMLCLINKETKKLIGRAVVWDKVSINGEEAVFLDRIYTAKTLFESAVKDYCKRKGWYFKHVQGAGNMNITNGKKTIEVPNIIFHLNDKVDWEKCSKKPYLDTMSFFGYVSNNDKCLPVLTSYENCNYKFNFKGTDGNVYENGRYDSRKDILNRRLIESDLYLIKYDTGYAWIDDTDYTRQYAKNEFRYNIKLVRGNEELITIKGTKKNSKAKFNHKSNSISSYTDNRVPKELHVYMFDLFKDDLFFEVDNTYSYLKQVQFKLCDICPEHFRMVMDEAPQTVFSSDISKLSKELLNIILEKNPEFIFNLNVDAFIRIGHAFEESVIQKYISKYSDLSLIEGRIAIKASKERIETLCKRQRYTFTENHIQHKYGISRCFLTDGDDIYIHVESSWFTTLPLKTKVKCLRELSKIEKIVKFIIRDKSIMYNYGEVSGTIDEYSRDAVRVKIENFDVSCSVKELIILERDLKECLYQYLGSRNPDSYMHRFNF